MSFEPFILAEMPKKNTAFRFYGHLRDTSDTAGKTGYNLSGKTVRSFISKDGGAWTATTNTAVEITPSSANSPATSGTYGYFYIDLTASEMNAGVILLKCYLSDNESTFNSNSDALDIIIHTVAKKLVSFDDTVSDITSLSSDNPTVGEVLSLLWQWIRKGKGNQKRNLAKILK